MSQKTQQRFGFRATKGGESGSYNPSLELEKLKRIMINDPGKPPIRRSEPQGGQLDYAKRVSDSSLQSALDYRQSNLHL